MQASGWRPASERIWKIGSYTEKKKAGYAPRSSSGGKVGEVNFDEAAKLKKLVYVSTLCLSPLLSPSSCLSLWVTAGHVGQKVQDVLSERLLYKHTTRC